MHGRATALLRLAVFFSQFLGKRDFSVQEGRATGRRVQKHTNTASLPGFGFEDDGALEWHHTT